MNITAAKLVLILGALTAGSYACNCAHNNDAGRWIDVNSPAAEAAILIDAGGGCYQATTQGHMCVSFTNADQAVKDCLAEEADNDQSFHGDWFLWSAITCTDGDSHAQLTITV
ncbi:hypothetical protein AURDEDRAFT_130949 [Auricularia subglabra TFB-10046 SS5]|uniref:Secreted protein n=1 Tax=Auricularia subglabra (strain TFB-10046 / SS5) TaxID=717982 RepID=J0D776_AURST|nr:hypothetical protein AURDEDRAFT_130949 [Auricularia subglabra TFB-10046 SS5]